MFFSIDTTSDVAIYEQIVRQVQLAVADGTIVGGQMLPSVRQLSRELTLNSNTIAHAYRDLQDHGVLQPLRGRGMVVRRDAVEACQRIRNELVEASFRRAIADAATGGMNADEMRVVFERELNQLSKSESESTS